MASRIEPPPGILLARIKPGVDIEEYPPSVQAFHRAFYRQKKKFNASLKEAKEAGMEEFDFTATENDGTLYVGEVSGAARWNVGQTKKISTAFWRNVSNRISEGIGGTPMTTCVLRVWYSGTDGMGYSNCTRAWIDSRVSLQEFHDTIDRWKSGALLVSFNVQKEHSEIAHALSLCFFDRERPGILIDSNEERSPVILGVLNNVLSVHNLTAVHDNKYEVPRQTYDPLCATWSLCASFLVLSGFSSDETYLMLVDLKYTALAALSRMILKNNAGYRVAKTSRQMIDHSGVGTSPYCVLIGYPSFKCMPDNFTYGARSLGFRGAMLLNYVYWSLLVGKRKSSNVAVLTDKERAEAVRVAALDGVDKHPPVQFDGTLEGLENVNRKVRTLGASYKGPNWKLIITKTLLHRQKFYFTEASLADVRKALGTESEVSVESPEFAAAFGTPADAALAVETFVPDPEQAAATFEQKVLRLPPIFLLTLFAARNRMLGMYEPLPLYIVGKSIVKIDPLEAPPGDGGGSTK